ncbi:MAG: aldehyde dehydrogenase [Candidatus Pacebacteria bacterium]|nr:aldehyde dehydrogenase [Candidatus Paceibacterota bacterium]
MNKQMQIIEIKNIIKSQREYFKTGKTLSIESRIEALRSLKNTIINNEVLISDALYKDFKRSQFESYATEIGSIIEEIDHAINSLSSWARPKRVSTPLVLFYSRSYIVNDPYGVVLIMGAWNYPFSLSLIPLIGAIAAGNCAIVKPSETSPNSSKAITRIIKQSFAKEHVLAIEGGVDVATKLLSQRFDYIFFTGGVNIGKIVAKAAAKYLTPVTLELGGKSPCIVNDTADMQTVSKRIVWGKFINAGQTCIAPDYILVKKELKESLIKNLEDTIEKFYGDDPKKSHDYCRIINKRHLERLEGLLTGQEHVIGGKIDKKNLYISPTIIDNCSWKNKAMKEEIFGPILPIITYDHIDEAIEEVNKREKPLAIYLFTDNRELEERITKTTSSGGLCINATILHTSNYDLPFGGVGNSGIGNYHGKASFDTFSHKKSVMKKSFWPELDVSYPPYGNKLSILKMIWGNNFLK